MGCGASRQAAYGTDLRCTMQARPTVCVPHTSVSPADYTIVGLLGDGALGRVYLCDHPGGSSCALKVMSKADIRARSIEASLAVEREILLRSVGHPFVAQMQATFSTESFEYMCMELCEGSLFDAFHTWDLPAFTGGKGEPPHLQEQDARFYISELILGVQHIHALGYVYRDIKLENCLIDRRGHLRIADFDQAGKLEDMDGGEGTLGLRRKRLVGTPEYMAPEILRNLHEDNVTMGTGIDVWAIGVLLFELIHGRSPFTRQHADWGNRETYSAILFDEPFAVGKLRVVTKVRQPKSTFSVETLSLRKINISKSGLRSLLIRMLVKDPQQRMTLEDVLADKWMSGVDWAAVKGRMKEPPYRPDRSQASQTRARRRSVTKMLMSDSLMRPNWDEHACTSLRDLKPEQVLHHTSSEQAALALQPTPAAKNSALEPLPDSENLQTSCELRDPGGKFVDGSTHYNDREKQLRVESQDLMSMSSQLSLEKVRRLTVAYEDEDESIEETAEGTTSSSSDHAAFLGSDGAGHVSQ
jgi:serine/threonine protein kinase